MPSLANWKSIFALLFTAALAEGQTNLIKFQSTSTRTALLELYTSEGCSSCPPAEAWLSGLQDSPRLWKDFSPVAFHVDYWNDLGWKDRWSDAAFTERQRAYAQAWRAQNIYTPEYVLNGKEWSNWFTEKAGPKSGGEPAGSLTVTATATNRWSASFVPVGVAEGNYQVHAALLAGGIVSKVLAGENQGRQLNHDFAVVNLVQIGMTTSNNVARGKFVLDTPTIYYGKSVHRTLALTVWITRAGQLEPLQATGGWLIPPAQK